MSGRSRKTKQKGHSGPIDKSMVKKLVLGGCEVPSREFSMSIGRPDSTAARCHSKADGPVGDGLVGVRSVTVKSRIGLGVAKMLLKRGPELENIQLLE